MSAFLKLEGVKGDAVAAGYAGWITVRSVQFGKQPAISMGSGATQRSPGAETELHVTCAVGSHSPAIFTAMMQGNSLDGELAMMDGGVRYATVSLPRAVVTNYMTGGREGPTESFSLITATPYKWQLLPQATLPGRWLVTIGTWTGYFVFERTGTVYWTERNGMGRHNGAWKATATDVQWKFADKGDIRTFVIPVPNASNSISGRILPAGQGVFTMQRA